MAKIKKRESKQVNLNLTSMMDVVFQLIIFFLLVTNFTSADLPKLKPPDLKHSEATEIDHRDKIIVNVIPEGSSGMAKSVQVGSTSMLPGEMKKLTDLLKSEKATRPELQVDLRADASINYEQVEPVMNAVTAAGISRINLVAFLDADNPKRKKQ